MLQISELLQQPLARDSWLLPQAQHIWQQLAPASIETYRDQGLCHNSSSMLLCLIHAWQK
jgi:hypothetical protein